MRCFFFALTIWKDKPIGGGHGFENRSEITTRVGSTPTPSANGSVEQLVGSPDCKSGPFEACRFESYRFHHRHNESTIVRLSLEQVDSTCLIRGDNDGCLPALDAGGCRFESCFPDEVTKSNLFEIGSNWAMQEGQSQSCFPNEV